MYQDADYTYYGSKANSGVARVSKLRNGAVNGKTIITATDSKGLITFKSVGSGRWSDSRIAKELQRWRVNPEKEIVTVQII